MTTRDLAWRAGGLALFVAACATGLMERVGSSRQPGSTIDLLFGLMSFIVALAGVTLLVQGKRVPLSWRAERRRHRGDATATGSKRHWSDTATTRGARPPR